VTPDMPTAARAPGLRVAAIPFAAPYVDAVLPAGAVRVGPASTPSPWLDSEYLAAHAGEIDVLHLHVGLGTLRAAGLERWAETVRRIGVPLVVTVHQLRLSSPPTRDDAQLAAVLANAEVVLTLTPGAADEIAERFGRTAIVVAHPSVAEPVSGLGAERGLVGLVLGGPSPAPLDAGLLVRAAVSGAVSGGGRLRVLVEPGAVLPAVQSVAADDQIELREVRRGGVGWAAELQQLHVAVLTERRGTHSRDLEICRDVGTRVVAPGRGWFADQWSDVVTYGDDGDGGLDPVSLTAAIAAALTRPMPRPADRAWRDRQRDAVQQVHAQVYAQVAADRALR
jgi:hypothetical protein